jgi:hypothetical protein
VDWLFFGAIGGGAAVLAGLRLGLRTQQNAAATASGLRAVRDLAHVSPVLQQTALWTLADGGFERRALHGVLTRVREDVDVTAFDLETLRERRGEWAFLPVDEPFRIAGVVSVVACELAREFPHVLFKRAGRGDGLHDDNVADRLTHVAKAARDGLGLARSYAAELPATLPAAALALELPADWRAYSAAGELVHDLVGGGLGAALAAAGRRDLVVELIGGMVVVYPAAREVMGADALADLVATALAIVDGVLVATPPLAPRGVDGRAPAPGA